MEERFVATVTVMRDSGEISGGTKLVPQLDISF